MAFEKCFMVRWQLRSASGQMRTKKKGNYGNGVLQIENGCFTPLVFVANDVIGKECKRLAEMIADKRKAPNFDMLPHTATSYNI